MLQLLFVNMWYHLKRKKTFQWDEIFTDLTNKIHIMQARKKYNFLGLAIFVSIVGDVQRRNVRHDSCDFFATEAK